jgi:hypothetical protein
VATCGRAGPLIGYQAWEAPQCGQRTVVETDAAKTNPHEQV